jgi:glycosyltransferase involved in cell wall biosynthesis
MERPKLTVAIATMRRWKNFLSQTLPIYLNNPFIDYVVICDETGEDVDAIRESQYATHPKLRLYKNKEKLGAYYNKRQAFDKAPTDWVAILDSDNYFQDNYFQALNDLWIREGGPNTKTVYAAGSVTQYNTKNGQSDNKISGFSGLKIDKSSWNTILDIQGWNFLLNDGNFVVHKSLLNILPDDVNDSSIIATDAIYVARKAVAAGFTYWVVPELSYIHTVHDESYWLRTATESSRILMGKDWRI